MKGIILAGGKGTRLYPLTHSVSKQLLPVFDKPMIFYPLSILMLAEIREILIISTPNDIDNYKKLLGTGHHLGLEISYEIQESPNGLAQAFIIGEGFINDDSVCLILGDNIFYGHGMPELLGESKKIAQRGNASLYAFHVSNPKDYGIVDFDKNGRIIDIEEKPYKPKSNYALTGLYFYPNDVIDKAKNTKRSKRGEYEITSINQRYFKENRMQVHVLGRGYTWLDAGTHENLLEASNFIETLERRQGLKIACLEEIALLKGI